MKITVTGSLGNVSKELTKALIQNGHAVTVISHNPEKAEQIKALGAVPAIGSIEDVNFLIRVFQEPMPYIPWCRLWGMLPVIKTVLSL